MPTVEAEEIGGEGQGGSPAEGKVSLAMTDGTNKIL